MSDNDVTPRIVEFLERFSAAMGVGAKVNVEQRAEGPRINLDGEEVELLVRHRGEPLKALQHVVDMAFGRKLPEVGRSIGKTVVEFKKGVGGLEDEVREASSPRAAIDPEPVKAPQRVTPATPKPTFDDAPAAPTVPPKV